MTAHPAPPDRESPPRRARPAGGLAADLAIAALTVLVVRTASASLFPRGDPLFSPGWWWDTAVGVLITFAVMRAVRRFARKRLPVAG